MTAPSDPITALDFVMRAGDYVVLEVTVKDRNGNIVDISGFTGTWAMYTDEFLGSKFFEKTVGSGITLIDAVNGRLNIKVNPDDTKSLSTVEQYYHELRLVDASSNPQVSLVGVVNLKQSRIAAAA